MRARGSDDVVISGNGESIIQGGGIRRPQPHRRRRVRRSHQQSCAQRWVRLLCISRMAGPKPDRPELAPKRGALGLE